MVEQQLSKAYEAKCFANLDMNHSYWHFQIHEMSQECQSFIKTDVMFSQTRLLHGDLNENAHLH